jgi:hypothetical protein
MARHFNYYDSWRTEPLSCTCGWSGTFEQGLVETRDTLMESECPRCSTLVALVVYPTAQEVEQNEPEGSEFRQQVRQAKRREAGFAAVSLQKMEQLPEISAPEFFLEWGFEADALDEKWTVLRLGAQEIFREPALWEGWRRYLEVAGICSQRYGSRLRDLRPTDESMVYLLGDSLSAAEKIAEFRKVNFSGSR